MLEVNIFDSRFVAECRRRFAERLTLVDNSLYVFSDGVAIGFKEGRKFAKVCDDGLGTLFFAPTPRATEAIEELKRVNAVLELRNYVRRNFDTFVSSMTYTTEVADVWQNANVFVSDDRVYVAFPDATGTAVIRNREEKVKLRRRGLAVTVMPEIVEKFLGICEAADIDVIDLDAVEIIRRAYYGLAPIDPQHIPAHGYALVLLLQNRIILS
jgi:hypothetical protein